jgi:hypothetical protein
MFASNLWLAQVQRLVNISDESGMLCATIFDYASTGLSKLVEAFGE